MELAILDPSLVLLVGPSGAGKSTFARRHFPAQAIISSDELRAVLAGDPNDQAASGEAFQVLGLLLAGRLGRRLLSVVDATNLRASSRRRCLRLAHRHGLPVYAICFDYPFQAYLQLNRKRPDRRVEEGVVRAQVERMAGALADLRGEGYAAIHILRDPAQAAATEIQLVRHE